MNVLVSVVFSMLSVHYATAQYARCLNPNRRMGLCVQIDDCQSLYAVLDRPQLSPTDKQFIRSSACGMSPTQRPFVCCTSDTGYTRSRRNPFSFSDYDDDFEGGNAGAIDYFWRDATTTVRPTRRTVLLPNKQFGSQPWSFGHGDRAFQQLPGRTQLQPANRQSQQPRDYNTGTGTGTGSLPLPPSCGGVTIDNKILGGEDTELNEFPWLALLEYKRRIGGGMSTNCAGSLVNQRYVLTAAHCVTGRIERDVGTLTFVRLGEHDTRTAVDCVGGLCAPETQRFGIEQTLVHELYKESAPNQLHDIALVRLNENVRYSDSMRPVCLPGVVAADAKQVGQKYTVVGWGRTDKATRSPIKQKLVVNYWEPMQCRMKFAERRISIEATQMCAGGELRQDSCDGDSGGPLMRFRDNAWVLEGIVSFGYKCGYKGWPGVYTNVAAYDIWIRQNIRA